MEERYAIKIPLSHALVAWMPRHAAWTQTRFQPKSCGRTAYFQMRGKNYNGEVVPFGECCLFKRGPDDKYQDRWEKGVMVGKSDQTDEFILLTAIGACKSRSVRRLEEKDQYDKEFMEKCVGSPWNPKNSANTPAAHMAGDKLAPGARIHRLHIT